MHNADNHAPFVTCNSYKSGHVYEVWVNEEPVLFEKSPSSRRWSGWPLQLGQNRLEVHVSRSSEEIAVKSELEVYFHEKGQDKCILNLNQIQTNSPAIYRSDFTLNESPVEAKVVAGVKIDNQHALRATLALAEAIASLKPEAIAEVLQISLAEASRMLPEWALQEGAKNRLKITFVRDLNDLRAIAGHKLLLVRTSESFGAKEKQVNLVRIEDKTNSVSYELTSLVVFFDGTGNPCIQDSTGGQFRFSAKIK